MLRQRQRILLLVCGTFALLCLYLLYSRGQDAKITEQSIDKAEAAELHWTQQPGQAPADVGPTPPRVAADDSAGSAAGADDQTDHRALRTLALQPLAENKCRSYEELRNVDFQQPALEDSLCSGVKAYKKTATADYPMCKLPDPFDQRLLDVVRNGSATADLLDLKNLPVKMFIYPERDYISESIKKTHRWESGHVHATMKFAQLVPDATFLDAGCNIGVYSILAARLGLPVVSLDANIRNLLRLRLSLSAASLHASLVWNFIGSGDELSYLNFPDDCNVGGATKFGRAVRDTVPVMPVRSERLCDLIATKNVVIKLDVEGGEADFLRTSGRLFSDFKVALVQMEYLKKHMVGNDSDTITDFFVSRHFSAWRIPGLSELDTGAASKWGDGDLVWVHQDFRHLVPEVKKGR